MICEERDFYLIDGDKWVPNFTILLKNREKKNIFYMSSHIPSLVAAVQAGYCFCPVVDKSWQSVMSDYQLNLVENYLMRQRTRNSNRIGNLKDFEFLINDQEIKLNIELE